MMLKGVLTTMVERLDDKSLIALGVIPWSSPVISFGDITRSHVATLGINPSNREFENLDGNELDGSARRFHTLKSLGLERWSDTGVEHLQMIIESCYTYFQRNPYDAWFKKLDRLMVQAQVSYYNSPLKACHLDLIPYATACKWTALNHSQRNGLLANAGDMLGRMIADSPIRILILNGNSVVQNFEKVAGVQLEKRAMASWALPRSQSEQVSGIAYKGALSEIAGIELRQELVVLGFNHNIQSSFGVTTQVMDAIQRWISLEIKVAIT
jgi:hypothetical protein